MTHALVAFGGIDDKIFISERYCLYRALRLANPQLMQASVIESAIYIYRLFDSHARLRAVVRAEDEQSRSLAGSRQHHAFRQAELHLARREVGDHHRHAPLQFLRIVNRLDAREHRARLRFADVQRQLQQLLRTFDMLALTIFATRRSILLNSSMLMVSAIGAILFPRPQAGEGLGRGCVLLCLGMAYRRGRRYKGFFVGFDHGIY